MKHFTIEELEAGFDEIRRAPADEGVLQLIVRRPRDGERDLVGEAALDTVEGLRGDNWKSRGGSPTADPELQLTIMNSRVIALLAQQKSRWPLAGDQLFIDMDLSAENLPPGAQLSLGTAVIEVSRHPHNGCKKFAERFGADAIKFVNSPIGKQLRLRGMNARVVQSGVIRVGDVARKLRQSV